MKRTVYLPDDLDAEAKEHGLPLSALLQGAIYDELQRIEAMNKLDSKMQDIELNLQDADGNEYVARFEGYPLDEQGAVYATSDERVLFFDEMNSDYTDISELDAEELANYFPNQSVYIQAMNTLGLKPVVNI